MLFAMQMALPGVPFVNIGDLWGERGTLGRPERLDSRTVTSWGPGRHAEFSEAEHITAALSPDWRSTNLRTQWGVPGSFFERARARILMRNRLTPLQVGDWESIASYGPPTAPGHEIFAYARKIPSADEMPGTDVLVVHNLVPHGRHVDVDLGKWETHRLLSLKLDDPDFTGGGHTDDWKEMPWIGHRLHQLELGPSETLVLHPFKHDPTIF